RKVFFPSARRMAYDASVWAQELDKKKSAWRRIAPFVYRGTSKILKKLQGKANKFTIKLQFI
ncbi:hypothetical protein SAMN04487936_103292, partial [Halobacillus dabanensis]